LVLASILLFFVALGLSTLFVTHNENDEQIYLTLADKVSKNFTDYTLQGTPLLAQLPQGTYNQPIFLRPPLFAYLLALLGFFQGRVLLPLISGLGALWITFFIGKKLGLPPSTALNACLLLSVCPILLFASTRILIDALLALLVSVTLLLFLTAQERSSAILFILAGVVFGLAILTKETAVLIVPVLLYVTFRRTDEPLKTLLYFSFPAVLVCSPWFYYFHKLTGTFIKGSEITEENLKLPFVDMMVHRPWYFYFVQIVSLSPVYAFGYFEIAERLKKNETLTEAVWVVSYFVPLTIFGLLGQGYQTRYVLPAIPGLALLTANGLRRRANWATITAIFLLAYALWAAVLNSLLFRPGDLFWPFEFLVEFARKSV